MASAFLFYRVNYKTYPGYGSWLCSLFAMAIGYCSIIFRETMPTALGIGLTNVAFISVGVFRLDAVKRFTQGQELKKVYYLLPVAVLPFAMYFYLVKDAIIIRTFFTSLFLALPALLISAELYKNRNRENSNLFLAIAGLNAFNVLLLMLRAIIGLSSTNATLFSSEKIHQIYFLAVIVIEVGVGIAWLMMNNQRLEVELRASRDSLQTTNTELEKALSEVKALSGIIPICMHCKEIRDDKGYWNQLETFISRHSEAKFNHSICPRCLKEKYPDLDDD